MKNNRRFTKTVFLRYLKKHFCVRFVDRFLRCQEKQRRGLFIVAAWFVLLRLQCLMLRNRKDLEGWLQNSLRKPVGKPSDSLWQRLPLCHKQNTRRLSLLPTPASLGLCQTEQSVSQPRLLSSTLSLPLSLTI